MHHPPTLLVTGFEPFAGEPRNPSGEIALRLDGKTVAGARIAGLVLPVAREGVFEPVRAALEALTPRAVLALGVALKRPVVEVEQVAVNFDDYRIADNSGEKIDGRPIAPDGPDALFATLPVKSLVAAMRAAGVPARVSMTAGTYLCNHLFYRLLHYVREWPARRRPGIVFIHVPPLPECVAAGDNERPSMALELSERAVVAAVESVAATWSARGART